jgi:excinuclease ABC subunit A
LALLAEGTRLTFLAPLPNTADLRRLVPELLRQGFLRARIDGTIESLEEVRAAPGQHARVEVVLDRIVAGPDKRDRVQEAVASGLKTGSGTLAVLVGNDERAYSTQPRCLRCHHDIPLLSPRLFSFNTPIGACARCQGLGFVKEVDDTLLVKPTESLALGAILAWSGAQRVAMLKWAEKQGIPIDLPWADLPWELRLRVLEGDDQTDGARATAARRSDGPWWVEATCPACQGCRLNADSCAVTVAGQSLPQLLSATVAQVRSFVGTLPATPVLAPIADELTRRLEFLDRVGLHYLELNRPAASLSNGEFQRLRLGAQLGNQLGGVLYVLDEPTAGLHPTDTARLVALLRELVDQHNTVLVVEHDPAVIAAANLVIEIGPGAGADGGLVTFMGAPSALAASETTTGRWFSGREQFAPHARLTPRSWLVVREMSGRHLRGNVRLPLGVLAALAGPSGSGKSSFLFDLLAPALAGRPALAHDGMEGPRPERIVRVDGTPLAKVGRSSVATATKIWEPIRQLLARTALAKERGFGPDRFSMGAAGGRCEACHGEGERRVAMHFLPDVVVPCETCEGKRFNEATLSVTYRGFSAGELLRLPIRNARDVFAAIPALSGVLETLDTLGLGYVTLGQSVESLSGGEAQRLKLARELGKPGEVSGSLYLLDEPTVGLHPADVAHLVEALRRLVTLGASVVVIEHDPQFLAACDWVIEMGPGAGEAGGRVVAEFAPDA